MDLSGLANAAKAAPGASYVVSADDQTFENVLNLSMRHPLVVEFHSPRANAAQLSDDLAALANAAGGKYLLVRVNVDEARGIAQALGIQAVPMVVGALGGQLVPLFQGTRSKEEAAGLIDELMKAAVANGMVGRAQPVPDEQSPADDAEAATDPKYAAADAAMERGDFAKAVEEFDKILADAPRDADALAGKGGAELLVRASVLDPTLVAAKAKAQPDDVDAQLDAADLEFAGGSPDAAFERLVALVRETAGDDRERVRVRLLTLFDTLGPADPAVIKGRRALMSALF